ncbi:MAG TPA: class I SAM-dependent methyltransferase [Kiritimatiellia bacterium]|nr:class I SAM-dependent methyltransferase [Kiritimatiellia bacterium]
MSPPLHNEWTVHEVEWSPMQVKRFWDALSGLSASADQYFTHQVGDALLRATSPWIDLRGRILDYAAGRGYLARHLLEAGAGRVDCAEFSPESLASIETLVGGHARYGAGFLVSEFPTTLPSASYDVAFLVETAEHLDPPWRGKTFAELHRVLKPGARLVVTVPNAENLEKNKVLCPECGARFHRIQHVASFTSDTLTSECARAGFHALSCRAIDLEDWKPVSAFRRARRRLRTALLRPAPPHLVYIGTRS